MNMQVRVVALSLVAALAGVGLALAHEGHAHKVRGVVSAFHADTKTLDVKAPDGTVAAILVSDTTRYSKGAAAGKASDLVAGARVVVSYKEEGGAKTATEIRIGAAAPAPAASPVPSPKI